MDVSYVTLLPTMRRGYFLVVVMEPRGDDYHEKHVSHPLKEEAARALAQSWAAAAHLEVR